MGNNKIECPTISAPLFGCAGAERKKAKTIYVDLENYELFTKTGRYGFILDIYETQRRPDTLRLRVLLVSENKYINGGITLMSLKIPTNEKSV